MLSSINATPPSIFTEKPIFLSLNTTEIPAPLPEPLPIWPRALDTWQWSWDLHVFGLGTLYLLAVLVSVTLGAILARRLRKHPLIFAILLLLTALCASKSLSMFVDPYHSTSMLPHSVVYASHGLTFPSVIALSTLLERVLARMLRPRERSLCSTPRRVFALALACYFVLVAAIYGVVAGNPGRKHWIVLAQMIFITWGFAASFLVLYKCYRLGRYCRRSRHALQEIVEYVRVKRQLMESPGPPGVGSGRGAHLRIARTRADVEDRVLAVQSDAGTSTDSTSRCDNVSRADSSFGNKRYIAGRPIPRNYHTRKHGEPSLEDSSMNAAHGIHALLNGRFCMSDYYPSDTSPRSESAMTSYLDRGSDLAICPTAQGNDDDAGLSQSAIPSSNDCLVTRDVDINDVTAARDVTMGRFDVLYCNGLSSLSAAKRSIAKRLRPRRKRRSRFARHVTHTNNAFDLDSDFQSDFGLQQIDLSLHDLELDRPPTSHNQRVTTIKLNDCNGQVMETDFNESHSKPRIVLNETSIEVSVDCMSECADMESVDLGGTVKKRDENLYDGKDGGYLADTELCSRPECMTNNSTVLRLYKDDCVEVDSAESPKRQLFPLPARNNCLGLRRILQGCVIRNTVMAAYVHVTSSFVICSIQVYALFGVYGVLSNEQVAEPWPWYAFQTIARLSELLFIYSLLLLCGLVVRPLRPLRVLRHHHKTRHQSSVIQPVEDIHC